MLDEIKVGLFMNSHFIHTLDQALSHIKELETENADLRKQLNSVYEKEHLRLFFDLGLVGMTLTSLEKGWLLVNQRLCEMLGYTREEMLTKTWADLTHPDDLEEDIRLFESVLSGKRDGYQLDKRYVRKDGTTFHARIDVKCVRNEHGQPDKFIGMIADISDLMNTQRQLEENKKRLDLAIDGAEMGLWDWNVLTGETFFNDRWYDITGYEPDELENKVASWEAVIHPEDVEAVGGVLRAHLKGLTPIFRSEHRIIKKDGEVAWVQDVGRVFEHDGEKAPSRAVGMTLDVTPQKMAEQALERREALITGMSEASHDALIMIDDHGLISFWSQAPRTCSAGFQGKS
ncbi:PAS domain S-box protein [Salidesulfovibrio brasiliensis]|uniref:PAS domain S-box protein n=1 Tax=Salidesulfovibrio brasiliensis TaxID=221711 RepID=UPI0006CFA7C5|nr:PAS domain S-box protein [Salidesulfovibrio brasiliensis]